MAIDTRVLTRSTRTGVEEYAINLLSRLLRLGENIEFKLFYNAYKKNKLDYKWVNLPNVKLYEMRIPNRFLFISTKFFDYPKIDKLVGGAENFFNPHFFSAPLSRSCRKAMTFHDLSFEYHPEFFSWRKRIWQKYLMNVEQEAQGAEKIIAVSRSTKEDLMDFYKINPGRIKVIYSGVDDKFEKKELCESESEGIKKKYRLPQNFILYFGTVEPRKNIVGLISAFQLIKGRIKNKELKLVIAGARGWLYQDIFKAAKNSKYSQDIIFTGFVEPADKVFLYNLASLFVYPSFFEGFGFPPLEAMACGLPVITSNTSSLPEVVGDAALMVDPYNIDELAWAMAEVLAGDDLRRELIARGLARAKMFSWEKCAKETLDFLTS